MKTFMNPFEIYAEKQLLWLGLLLALITAFVSSYTDHLIFGSLKVINNYHQTWYEAIANITITLLSNSFILYLFARFRYAKTRFIDVLNVVLIAHIVIYLMLYLTATPIIQEATTAVELEVLNKGFAAPDISKLHMITLGVFGILVLSLLIYFFYLLVVGMKIAMNSKNKVDIFIIVILVFAWNTILQFINPFISS